MTNTCLEKETALNQDQKNFLRSVLQTTTDIKINQTKTWKKSYQNPFFMSAGPDLLPRRESERVDQHQKV